VKYEDKTSIKMWAEDDQPREKLIIKGQSALSDAELIAIIIRSGSRQISAVDLAKRLLILFENDLNKLAKSGIETLLTVPGIGVAKATGIVAALELSKRKIQIKHQKKISIKSSADVHAIMKHHFYDLQHEEFWILVLSRSNEVLLQKRISQGGVSGTVADNKLIFKYCLDVLGSSIIALHNHPSGNLKPSKADETLTKKIKLAGQNLDRQLLDHLIVCNDIFYSFADEGLL